MSDLVPVKLSASVKAELESLKVHPAERLSDVVARLLAQRQYPARENGSTQERRTKAAS